MAQKTGAGIGTFTFNGIRLMIGGLVLLPAVIFSYKKFNKNRADGDINLFDFKEALKGSLACGTALFLGTTLQQHAFTYDLEAGKVAFITSLYMILVPILGIFLHRKAHLNLWIGVALGIIGLYLICMNGSDFSGIGVGEICALSCAVCFAFHILIVDYYCTRVNNILLSCGQFLFAGIISMVCMFIFEDVNVNDVFDMAVPLLYAGIGSCGLGFTFQVFGQKTTEPALAALLMCFESVFAAIFGWLILKDHLTARVLTGCAIMFAGVIASQLDFSPKNKKEVNDND